MWREGLRWWEDPDCASNRDGVRNGESVRDEDVLHRVDLRDLNTEGYGAERWGMLRVRQVICNECR